MTNCSGGGLTRSARLLEILSDVVGLPVQHAERPEQLSRAV